MSKQRHTVTPRTLCFVFDETKEKFLLIKFSPKKGHLAWWHNALGGHLEKWEDIIQSANREIQEESWLIVADTRLAWVVHVSDFFEKDVLMFVTQSTAPTIEVTACDEWELLRVAIDQVNDYKIFEDIPLLLDAIRNNPNNCFTGTSSYDQQGNLSIFSLH